MKTVRLPSFGSKESETRSSGKDLKKRGVLGLIKFPRELREEVAHLIVILNPFSSLPESP